MNLDLKKSDIIGFLHSSLLAFEPLASSRNIDLRFEGRIKPYYFCFDGDKLEKVFSDLLAAALKITPDGEWVKLRFVEAERNPSGRALVEIINPVKEKSGEENTVVFYPSGDDLAPSKSLVQLHGGKIEFMNRMHPDGTFECGFLIALPLNNDQIAEGRVLQKATGEIETSLVSQVPKDVQSFEAAGLKKEPVLINGRTPLLLLVEDNQDLRSYLKVHFEDFYKVIEAENGKQALSLAIHELPDLIISDVMMPEMDGFQFCKEVKTDSRSGHIPVVLLTAKSQVEDQIEGIETGADAYITKPFNLEFLTSRVKNLLLSRQSLKQKYRKEISITPTEDNSLSPDDKFLRKLLEYIENRISSTELNVEDICNEICVSRAKLYRKVKDLTGLTIAEVIKEIRFKRAKQLLREQKFKINEIAFMVGFSEANYFGKCFKAEFGISPSEYVQSCNDTQSKGVE